MTSPPRRGRLIWPAPGAFWRYPANGSACSGSASRPSGGHRPAAVFQERWLALLAAAVLPGTRRDAAFRLHKESGPGSFAIETGKGGEPVGHSALFDERLIRNLDSVYVGRILPREVGDGK